MASAVDICNLAASHIGETPNIASISPADGSALAEAAARFYPIARDYILEKHGWNFAKRRKDLANLDNELDSWTYCYEYPSDCIKPIRLLMPEATDDNDGQDFLVETLESGTKVVYCNVENAVLVYTRQVTDTTKFSPMFVDAVSWQLAGYLAGPITKDAKLKKACFEMAEHRTAEARISDSNSQRNASYGARHTPGAIAARA